MDKVWENLMKNVKNVGHYTSLTQEIMNRYKNTRININLTTALFISNAKSFEIMYFSKSHESGAAGFLFERLLSLPPSKTWGILNKELISTLQFWLQTVKNRLLTNSDLWWKFLKLILKIIKEIRVKDSSMPDKLAELTADSLFDMASTETLSAQQRHEILHCLNMYCAESSREVRFTMRNKFNGYFTKLAHQMCSCGYLPLQFSALEALMRWLIPRGELSLRAAVAARWFPPDRCPEPVRQIFLDASWMRFFEDSRRFLNALNNANGLVTSVICKRLFVGEILVVSGAEKLQTWIDINSSTASVSVMMDPRVLDSLDQLGKDLRGFETLVIEGGSTQAARLHSDTRELTLSLKTECPPLVQPCGLPVGGGGDVSIIISSKTDLKKLDSALKAVFGDKYQVTLESLDAGLSLTPPVQETRRNLNSSSDESRFSNPADRVKHRRHTGVGLAYRRFGARVESSPSTTSTTSLLQLHDKLAALPWNRYTVNRNRIYSPQLSNVTEISEPDSVCMRHLSNVNEANEPDNNCVRLQPSNVTDNRKVDVAHSNVSASTVKFAPYDVGVAICRQKKKAESDSELFKRKPETTRSVVNEDLSTSTLLVANLGSDESLINDSIKRLSKSKNFQNTNIVELLVQEALEAVAEDKLKDTGVNSDANKLQETGENSEVIDTTPVEDVRNLAYKSRFAKKKPCTVVSKSTTDDESNTEAILDTPCYVYARKSKPLRTVVVKELEQKKAENIFDAHVEDFFSQHIVATKTGEIEISPALARKINASTSNTSESFDEDCLTVNEDLNLDVEKLEINDIEVIECLNDMVDKVSKDFLQYWCGEGNPTDKNDDEAFVNKQAKKNNNSKNNMPKNKTESDSKKSIKLTFKPNKGKKTKAAAKPKKNQTKNKSPKMSTIIEQNDEEMRESRTVKCNTESVKVTKVDVSVKNNTVKESPTEENSIVKRKRKLYSPKDDEIYKETKEEETKLSDSEDDINLAALKSIHNNETPKSTAACYKEIQRERKKHIRQPRLRKSRGKFVKSPSPTTLENDAIFDKLKSTVENNEKLITVDTKSADYIYNYSSDSEDADFEMKKNELRKRLNLKAVANSESSATVKPGKQRTRRNYSRKSNNDEAKKIKQIKKTAATQKTNIKSKAIDIEPIIELCDERMRVVGPEDILNTSIVTAKPKAKKPVKIDLILDDPPQMAVINDQETVPRKWKHNKSTKSALSTLKNKDSKAVSDNDDSGTLSPLPGLIVEAVTTRKDDTIDLNIAAMERKIQQMYEEGPDCINETSNTQNMLVSDNDISNNVPINIINDEIDLIGKENTMPRVERKVPTKRKLNKNTNNKPKFSSKKVKVSQNKDGTDEHIEIEIPDSFECEKSISSDGINAHANSDELPPSPGLLEKRIPPREVTDMNETIKSYFEAFNRELYGASRERCETFVSEKNLSTSPVALPHKHQFDFRKMVPSRKTSDSSSHNANVHETSHIQVQQIQSNDDATKQEANCEVPSQSKKDKVLPIVSVVPLSIEDIDRWSQPKSLKSKDRSETSVSSNKGKHPCPKIIYNTRKTPDKINYNYDDSSSDYEWKMDPKTKHKTTKSKDTDSDVSDEITKYSKKTKVTRKRIDESLSNNSPTNVSKNIRYSTISPIVIDCFIPKKYSKQSSPITRKVSIERVKTRYAMTSQNDSDQSSPIIRNISNERAKFAMISQNDSDQSSPITRNILKERTKPKSPMISQNDSDQSSPIIKKVSNERTKSRMIPQNDSNQISPIIRKVSDERAKPKSRMIPQNDSDQSSPTTKKVLNERVKTKPAIITEIHNLPSTSSFQIAQQITEPTYPLSGPSDSSVIDWFRRNDISTHDINILTHIEDSLKSVWEKLDTSLVQSNQNTSKKFVEFVIQVQNLLEEQKNELAVFKTAIKRCEEKTTEVMEVLKKNVTQVLRQDRTQKELVVTIIKEDIQAALDFIKRVKSKQS